MPSVRSSARLQASLTREDFTRVQKQLVTDLRIGSSLHIGEKHSREPFSPELNEINSQSISGVRPERVPSKHQKHFVECMFYSPLELLRAREQGDCGMSTRSHRLRSFFRRLDPIRYPGHVVRWPANQTFKEHIQGNMWSVASLRLESTHKHHSGCVNALNFSPSGRLIASASDDQRVAVTDFYKGSLLSKFHSGHNLNVFQVKFVPETNETQIVTAARDSMVRLAIMHEDGATAATTRCLAKHDGPCHKVSFVADEPSVFLSAGEDGCVFSIDLRESKAKKILSLPLSSFYSVCTNPLRPAEFCVCGKSESVVRVFDRRKILSDGVVSGFLHSFVPPHLASTAKVRRAQQPRNEERHGEEEDDESISDEDEEAEPAVTAERGGLSLQLSRHIRMLLSRDTPSWAQRSARGRLNLPSRLDPLNDHTPTKYNITAAVYSAQGDAILASFNDEDIYLFNSRDPSLPPVHAYRCHRNMNTVKGVNFFGPNSEYVVSGSDDGFVYIWDRHSEGIVQWLCADLNGSVNVLEPHPFLPVLATSGIDYDFKIWSPHPPFPSTDTPEAWLPSIKNPERDRSLLFDPEPVAIAMNQLRKSPLATYLFGDEVNPNGKKTAAATTTAPTGADVTVTAEASPMTSTKASARKNSPLTAMETEESKQSNSEEEPAAPAGVAAPQSSAEPAGSPVDEAKTNKVRRKRRVLNRSRSDSSLEGCRQKRSKSSSAEPGGAGVGESWKRGEDDCTMSTGVVQAPQSCLPFNARDLQLRVAMNWIERCRESLSFSFLGNSEMRLLSTLASITSARLRFSDVFSGEGDDNNEERELHLSWDDDDEEVGEGETSGRDEEGRGSMGPDTPRRSANGERVCLVIRRPPRAGNLIISPSESSTSSSLEQETVASGLSESRLSSSASSSSTDACSDSEEDDDDPTPLTSPNPMDDLDSVD
ncbi:hypothetical protein AAHC03_05311 [Spirometra sp. Aus1]